MAANWSQAYDEEPKVRNYRKHHHRRRSCGDGDADDGFETSDVRKYIREAMVDMVGSIAVGTTAMAVVIWCSWKIANE